MLIIILITLFILFVVYRFCKVSKSSDNQELEDELFRKTYGKKNNDDAE